MTTRLREGRWTLDLRHNGTRYRLAVPDDKQTRRGAEAYEKAVLADLARGIDPRKPREAPTLAEYIVDYLAAQETRCRPGTVRAKRSAGATWIVPVLGAVKLDQVRTRHAEQLRDAMRGRKVGTTANVLRMLGHVVKTWHRHHELPIPSLDLGRFRDEEKEPAHYMPHDVERLLSGARVAGLDALVLVLLGADAGLRCGEVMALRWTDVRGDQLVVARSRDSYDTEGPTKSGRTRHVPLTDRLRSALASGSRDAEYVLHDRGVPLTHKQARALLHQAQAPAGMETTGLHILRHTFCTSLARAGVPINVIAALAGHQDLRVTARYLHSCRDDLTRGIAALGGGHTLGTSSQEGRGARDDRPRPFPPKFARNLPWRITCATEPIPELEGEGATALGTPCDPVPGHARIAPVDPDRALRAKRTDLAAIHRRIEARVDAWIEANGKTRTWLAEETGMGAASMRRALRGPSADKPTSPTLGTLDRFAAVLGIGVDELVSPLDDED